MSRSVRPLSLCGPRPLQLVDGNMPITSPSSCPSPTVSGLSTPPLTARSAKARRQSSISYYPSDHSPNWDIRSPTTAYSTPQRSNSLGLRTTEAAVKGDRRSTGSIDSPIAERAPLTLTEKHADLLQFIAQKESKCLELRSQLATHEAELSQLKRKWERIVSRGMDRISLPAGPSTPVTANGVVLDGIREGVHGVGRLLAAGLDLSPSSPALMSSVSTTGTRSSAQSSVRLSQSSASSLAFDEPLRELDERDEGSPDHAVQQSAKSSVELSPNELRAAKLHRRKSRDRPSVQTLMSSLEPASPSPVSPPMSAPATSRQYKRSSIGASAGLAPAASIPGLGSTWMESVGSTVGRRWEELQKGETFTKSQKRASLLLSDVSQSLRAALAAPGATTGSPSSVSISSNPFAAALSPLSSSPQRSLLEDDDEGAASALGGVLVPDAAPLSSRPSPSPSVSAAEVQSSTDDEDWNW
ncbi:hypothetical protein B0H21DRAFT_781424 [Amylocystis lapponica]|nr:hypothetical protein B0H21DRAFT_781424 [Amylocystis lapponica]